MTPVLGKDGAQRTMLHQSYRHMITPSIPIPAEGPGRSVSQAAQNGLWLHPVGIVWKPEARFVPTTLEV